MDFGEHGESKWMRQYTDGILDGVRGGGGGRVDGGGRWQEDHPAVEIIRRQERPYIMYSVYANIHAKT